MPDDDFTQLSNRMFLIRKNSRQRISEYRQRFFNVTACFARFVSALSGSHSNLNDILHYSNTPLFPAGLVLPWMNTDFYHPSAQDRRCLESTPAKYASAAAIVPTKSVVRPECHHGEVDHLLLIEPMMTKTIAVRVTESRRECSVRKR